jgi:hypothetical protein
MARAWEAHFIQLWEAGATQAASYGCVERRHVAEEG